MISFLSFLAILRRNTPGSFKQGVVFLFFKGRGSFPPGEMWCMVRGVEVGKMAKQKFFRLLHARMIYGCMARSGSIPIKRQRSYIQGGQGGVVIVSCGFPCQRRRHAIHSSLIDALNQMVAYQPNIFSYLNVYPTFYSGVMASITIFAGLFLLPLSTSSPFTSANLPHYAGLRIMKQHAANTLPLHLIILLLPVFHPFRIRLRLSSSGR